MKTYVMKVIIRTDASVVDVLEVFADMCVQLETLEEDGAEVVRLDANCEEACATCVGSGLVFHPDGTPECCDSCGGAG